MIVKLSAYVFPLTLTAEGFGLLSVAKPPEIDKTKSVGSNVPLALVVLYVASLRVTYRVSFVAGSDTEVIFGGCLSKRFTELFA